mgnify:CR=1 FL=1
MPTLNGEANRRQQIEKDAAEEVGLQFNIRVHYKYMPIPDWQSATPEQYKAVAEDAAKFGANTMVAMHCASSFGRTGGMIQTVLAATSEEGYSDASELSKRAAQLYLGGNAELEEYDRPENALNAGNRVRKL